MTITATPANYSSVHGDLVYTVYSTNSEDSATYPNFKYVADVYVNGTLIATLRKQQDPTTGVGIFNLGQVVRNYMATAFNPATPAIVAQTLGLGEFYLNVLVSFGEEYNYTTYVDLATDTTRKFYNHYNARLQGVNTILSAKVGKLATNNNFTGKVLLTTSFYLVPFFPPDLTGVLFPDPFTGEDASQIPFVVTPVGGGSPFSTSFSVADWVNLKVLNIAPVVLNALHAGCITSATKYYTVQISNETYRVDLICEAQYETYMLHFLNQYGGFESKLFTKVSRRKYKIEKKNFGKLNYTVDNTGAVSYKNSNGVYNESTSVYSSQFDEKLTLNSDLLTDAEYLWLRDLIVSPMVYIQDGAYFYPVNISETDYEPKKAIMLIIS